MKKIKNLLSNVVVLILLLVLGVGLVMFLSSRSQNNVTAQSPNTKLAVQDQKKPTPKPDPEQKPTLTPTVDTTVPEDDRPEPTWTPHVVDTSDITPPPLPVPPPTLTPTPINPREEMVIKLNGIAGQFDFSPDNRELVFIQVNRDKMRSEVWKINLADKRLTILSDSGTFPEWSPDGRKISFLRRYTTDNLELRAELRVVDLDGKNERILMDKVRDEVLDFYWDSSDKINIVSPSGIDSIDQNDKVRRKVDLVLPETVQNKAGPPKTDGRPDNFIVLNEQPPLQIIPHIGDRTIITNPEELSISDFSLSPNRKQIAYIAGYGPLNGLWVTDLAGKGHKKLFDLPNGGSFTTPKWSPNGRFLVVGFRPTGTYYASSYELTMIDVKRGRIIDLDVSDASSVVWSRDGRWLYYTRPILVEPPNKYDVTLYRIGVGR